MLGARLRNATLLEVGRQTMLGGWLVWLAMSAALIYGLVTNDFANKYIADYPSPHSGHYNGHLLKEQIESEIESLNSILNSILPDRLRLGDFFSH